ncbi:WD repeat-containing protein 26 [Phtheirospermum japonicum]|uniref:WD repeat-containing protein 26 n=1 Tax=Phtheirospermum japonicum TaxID=374723 RepID=A0A830CPX3_9LAMI|nr:WD repeat-containing protein 26 [Phtheirospermum japonicum]
MGGVEDNEPPSKRVKVSSLESGGPSNGTSVIEQGSCSLSDSMARVLASLSDDEVVGSNGVIRKVELVRIIAEALYSLGYSRTGARLEEESGIPLHSSAVELFMYHVREGRWDESVSMLREIGVIDEKMIKLASFVILEQKFFEFLDGGKTTDALKTLRTEITPLCVNEKRVRELACFLVSSSRNVRDGVSSGEARKKLLGELHKLLPATLMVPENRLVHLVEQALVLQKDACRFHNSSVVNMSLFIDHQCGRDNIPSQTLQILQEHSGEVWFLQFSHNGKYLASSSVDNVVIIWEVLVDGHVSLKYKLSGHQKPVFYITWSPDDGQLLTCGSEETIRRWDIASGECLHIYQKPGLGMVSCEWAPHGKSIFCGLTDKSISLWDLEGNELSCWNGLRTTSIGDLGTTIDGKVLITVCKENTIMLLGLETKSEKFIKEDQTITSFALSGDKKFLLVSLYNEELHLWNLDDCSRPVAKYKGHKRSRFVVRSCFGGFEQAFIASGSEDSQVYIWHRLSGELILTLAGHSGSVNCVSWNPANPHMLASASDDRTIRIWGLSQVDMDHSGRHSNGVHHCNGRT